MSVYALLLAAAVGMGGSAQAPQARNAHWRDVLVERLPTFGQRNWIVIADAAYPAQARTGIETILTHSSQLDVVQVVLEELGKTKHLRPIIFLDAELPSLTERDANGIGEYRRDLKSLLTDRKPESQPRDQILDRLDKASEKYKVLVLKTNHTLPYSSVYLELESGYWTPEAEKRLRDAIGAKK